MQYPQEKFYHNVRNSGVRTLSQVKTGLLLLAAVLRHPNRFASALAKFASSLKTRQGRKRASQQAYRHRKPISVALALLLVLTLVLFHSPEAFATSQGPLGAGTAATLVNGTSTNWTNPGNITASDSTYATVTLASTATSYYLQANTFGFSIPATATVNGVVVEVQKFATTASKNFMEDQTVSLMVGGTITGNNYATTATWPSTNSFVSYGGTADTWGLSLTPAQVNATNFGAAIAATNVHTSGASSSLTASVDYVRVTVYYTVNAVFQQASYRFFGNQDSSTPFTFATAWGGSAADQLRDTAVASDGSIYATGTTSSAGAGGQDLFLNKYDPSGTLIFSKTWGGTGTEVGSGVIATSDGGVAVAGYTDSMGAGLQDMMLLKFDSSGNLSWERLWGGTNYDQGLALAQTNDGGYVVTGTEASSGAGAYDVFAAKYTSTGTLSYSRTWGGTGTDSGQAVVPTSDGGFAIAGYQTSFGAGSNDTFLLKYDNTGTLSWSKIWGGTGDDYAFSLIQTSDGGYAIGGETLSFGAGGADNLLLKYDSSGSLTMQRTWGSAATDYSIDIQQTSDSGYILTGLTSGAGGGDITLSKVTSTGTLSYWDGLGGASSDSGHAIQIASDGGFIVGGNYQSAGAGSDDVIIAKYDSTGAIANCGALCGGPYAGNMATPTGTDATPAGTTASPTPTTSTPATAMAAAALTVTSVVALAPTIDVGSPLAAQNTAATTTGDGQPFRLRVDVGVTNNTATALGQNFKLQYAARGADNLCDTSFSGETYTDVTNSTPISYYDNPNAINNQLLTTNANDPTDGANALVRQSYQESGTTTFSNPNDITVGKDGMWDFALTTNNASGGTHYCLRLASSTGAVLNGGYSVVPEVVTPPPSYNQASYRFYQNSNVQPFTTITENPTTGTDAAYFTASDGTSLYICGYDSTGSNEWRIEKRNVSDGQLVSGFGTGGVVTENVSAGDDRCNSIVVTGGNLYLAGYDTGPGTSAELRFEKRDTTTGALVSGFGTGGAVTEDILTTTNDQIRALATDGTYLYAAGDVGSSGSDFQWRIEKRNLSDGSLVSGFNSGGIINENNFASNNEAPYAIVYDSGNIFVGGFDMPTANDGQYHLEKRDATTGALVSGFGSGGIVQENATTVADASGIPESITTNGITTDSNYIYTLGNDEQTASDTEWRFEKRDKTTGALVSGFGTGGVVTENPSTTYDTTQQLLSDGTYLYASGVDRSQDGGFSEWRIEKRSTATGALASRFGSGGIFTSNPTTSHDELRSIVMDGASLDAVGYDFVPGNYEWRIQKLATYDAGASGPDPVPSAAQNSAITNVTTGQQFRLRFLLGVSGSAIGVSGQSFKLQYAQQGADNACDTSFSGETYSDVSTSGAVQFQTNSNITSGTGAWRTTVDPTDGTNPTVLETYQSANPFSNAAGTIPVGSDGEWDASLVDASAAQGTKYCFRVVKSDGSTLDTYSVIPEMDTVIPNTSPAAPTLSAPSSGATGVSVSPAFTLKTTDADSDYLQYKILIYQSDCSTLVATADQTSSQTGWSGQDQQGGTAYTGSSSIGSSTLATYTYTGTLANGTTYCWKAAAIDPAGTNSFGSFSATQSFTTAAAAGTGSVIRGNLNIRGGVRFGS